MKLKKITTFEVDDKWIELEDWELWADEYFVK